MPYLNVSTNVILVIAGIGLLIFIHELGHFLMAKKIGARVLAFSLGFGPAILKKQWGETEYRLSLFPLGGYVKLAGENPDEEKTGASYEFSSKSIGQRASVLVAGVALNALLAFVAFIVAFQIGVPFITSEVGDVIPGQPAWQAGIQKGDKITEIGGIDDPDFEDIFTVVALSNTTTGIPIKVKRGNDIFRTEVIPMYDQEHGLQRIGIMPATSLEIDKIFAFENNESPARDAGIQVKDLVVAVNGKRITSESEFREVESQSAGKEITLTLLRNGEEIKVKVTPSKISRWMLGLSGASSIIDGVKYKSIASKAGLMKGDEIIEVNSNPIIGFTGFKNTFMAYEDKTCILTVKRNNKIILVSVPLEDAGAKEEFLKSITPFYGLTIDSVVPGFPAEKIGLQPGDKIISLNEKELHHWNELLLAVVSGQGKPITIGWMRGTEKLTSAIAPQKNGETAAGSIGVKFREKTEFKKYGLIGSCVVGFKKAVINVQRLYLTLRGFFSQRLSTKNVGGFILIAQASYESAKVGMGKLVYFLGILSLQLALLNILPVPVLDGGHLLFLLIEKIKGSPVSQKTLSIAQYIGFAMIISLVIYATRNDIMRLFTL
ncbi:RIP metalloprotease RseP [uncultured Candidatus Kuenenia sp.]|uniref:RIP metalloprotease RseP n=1 Tax=uncultured Candidatus Kuenenia sp. TaxID=1048336 RepID=UPI00031719A9|nr:RIP metalloprotease RseP [uncultured Candidatus Kuenenia sp.]MCF6151787.1 RIP metalloprotease RseP [Candidatus Kuenenia stuttgartiensis]MCL4726339.1 RIP metalloprotease RseP [Candidatus Kuenenia stuttgartiensis]